MPTITQFWTFQFSLNTTEPPTGSQIRMDAVAAVDVTKLWVRTVTNDSRDVTRLLLKLAIGKTLYLQDRDDSTKYVVFTLLAAAVDKTAEGYVELPVSFVEGGTALSAQAVDLYGNVQVGAPDPPALTGSGTPGSPAGWQTATALGNYAGTAPTTPTYAPCPWSYDGVHYTVNLLDPPTTWPITTTELEAAARILEGDEEPELEEAYIQAATEKVQLDTSLALPTQKIRVTLNAMPWVLRLPWPPLQTVDAVTLLAADGRAITLDPATYVVDPTSRPARLWFPGGAPSGVGVWHVDLTVGWADGTLPPLLVHAVRLLAAHYLTTGRDLTIVGTIVEDTPQGYEDAVQPYRLVTVV